MKINPREATTTVLELAETGFLDWKTLATELLNWMSEKEVEEFAKAKDIILEEDDE